MKKLIFFLLFVQFAFSQITFSGCPNFFASSNYFFYSVGLDLTGRNIYETIPISGDQSCPIGTCEFRIYWNNTISRWEFIADDGNGDFSSPNLIYYNTSASTPNPPSLSLGVWIENISVTAGQCGGNLTTTNCTLTGSVTLGNEEFEKLGVKMYPNPTTGSLSLELNDFENTAITIVDINGRIIQNHKLNNALTTFDVSNLAAGMYFLKISSEKANATQKFIKQ